MYKNKKSNFAWEIKGFSPNPKTGREIFPPGGEIRENFPPGGEISLRGGKFSLIPKGGGKIPPPWRTKCQTLLRIDGDVDQTIVIKRAYEV